MRGLILAAIIFAGCANKGYIFPRFETVRHFGECHESIGVDVDLGDYLLLGKAAYKKGERLYFLDEELAEDGEAFFQGKIAEYLREALMDPKIYRYPWQTPALPERIVHVEIAELYVDMDRREGVAKGTLLMDGRTIPLRIHTPWRSNVVDTLEGAFEALMERIAKEVGRFCRQARDTRLQPDSER